jgi:hypothetical protein
MRFDFAAASSLPFEDESEEEESVVGAGEGSAIAWDEADEQFFQQAVTAQAVPPQLPEFAADDVAPPLPTEQSIFGGRACSVSLSLPAAEVVCVRQACLLYGARVVAAPADVFRAVVERVELRSNGSAAAVTLRGGIVVALPPHDARPSPSPLIPLAAFLASLALGAQLRVGDVVLCHCGRVGAPRKARVVRAPRIAPRFPDSAAGGASSGEHLFGSILVEWLDIAAQSGNLVSPWDIVQFDSTRAGADVATNEISSASTVVRRLLAHPAAKHFRSVLRRALDSAPGGGAAAPLATLDARVCAVLGDVMFTSRSSSPRFLFAEALKERWSALVVEHANTNGARELS